MIDKKARIAIAGSINEARTYRDELPSGMIYRKQNYFPNTAKILRRGGFNRYARMSVSPRMNLDTTKFPLTRRKDCVKGQVSQWEYRVGSSSTFVVAGGC